MRVCKRLLCVRSSGWEARKEGRRERKLKMNALIEEKPDLTTDDPSDVAAIESEIKNMGDFKLKSGVDYQVPEDEEINYENKVKEWLLFEETIMNMKTAFNHRFLALRELKRRIIDKVKADMERVEEIGPSGEVHGVFEFVPEEWPEERDGLNAVQGGGDKGVKEGVKVMTGIPLIDMLSAVKKEDREGEDMLLEYERDVLLRRCKNTIEAFDRAVYELRREKSQVSCQVKELEVNEMLLYYELVLLKEFEKTDEALERSRENTLEQKNVALSEMSGCEERLSEKKAEMEVWQEKSVGNMEEFHRMVGGEANINYTVLLKLFKKKVKRQRSSEMNSDSDESGESDYSDEDSDDASEVEEDACPEGCDPGLYEKVLELREKKLDQEEMLNELQKSIEELKKSYDRFKGKEKQIAKDLTNSALEIQAFQNEKQRKLNELETFKVLKLSQLCGYGEKHGVLPESIDECLVFSTAVLESVYSRIDELKEENVDKSVEYKGLHLMQKRLGRERKTKEEEIGALEVRCEELQMLKFGQVIDIDVLEKMGENRNVDLQDKIEKRESEQRRVYNGIDKEIEEQKIKLLAETHVNTNKLQRIAKLTVKKRQLEEELNSAIKGSDSSSVSSQQHLVEEERLKGIAKVQGNQVEALKDEIMLLKRSNTRSNRNQLNSP